MWTLGVPLPIRRNLIRTDIRKEDLEVKYYDEESQEFPFFVGLHKWTYSA